MFRNVHIEVRILRLVLNLPFNLSGPVQKSREMKIVANDMYQSGKWLESIQIHTLLQLEKAKNRKVIQLGATNIRFLGSTFTESIGHMAIGLSVRAKILLSTPKFNQPRSIILTSESANKEYLKLWEKYFEIIKMSVSEIEIFEKMYWPLFDDIATVDVHGEIWDLYTAHNHFTRLNSTAEKLEPLLTVSEKINLDGRQFVKQIGGDPQKDFVTIHVRQSPRDKATYGRNAKIQTYRETIEHLTLSGFNVFRIGKNSQDLELDIPNYFDLTKLAHYSNIFDTYFLGSCNFMIGTTSGPLNVPHTFGKPTLATNTPDIARFINLPKSLVLPKKIQYRGRVLSLIEMLEMGAGYVDGYLENFGDGEMKWVDNSPQEILNATVEMMEQSYTLLTTDQIRIRSLISTYGYDGNVVISQSFIDNNKLLF
jgi:putative glycosyltransferase (TIGR04372 family)